MEDVISPSALFLDSTNSTLDSNTRLRIKSKEKSNTLVRIIARIKSKEKNRLDKMDDFFFWP